MSYDLGVSGTATVFKKQGSFSGLKPGRAVQPDFKTFSPLLLRHAKRGLYQALFLDTAQLPEVQKPAILLEDGLRMLFQLAGPHLLLSMDERRGGYLGSPWPGFQNGVYSAGVAGVRMFTHTRACVLCTYISIHIDIYTCIC